MKNNSGTLERIDAVPAEQQRAEERREETRREKREKEGDHFQQSKRQNTKELV